MTKQDHAGEPELSALLEDPLTRQLMRVDRVSLEELLAVIEGARRRLSGTASPKQKAAP